MSIGGAEFSQKAEGDVLSVRIEGEVDHHSAVSLREEVDREILEVRPKRLELDLSGVSFMDSSGIGLIMGRYNLMKELEGELVVAKTGPATERILRLAGLDRMVQINDGNAAKNESRAGNGRQKRKI